MGGDWGIERGRREGDGEERNGSKLHRESPSKSENERERGEKMEEVVICDLHLTPMTIMCMGYAFEVPLTNLLAEC